MPAKIYFTDEQKRCILKEYKKCGSTIKVGKKFGVNKKTINSCLKEQGITFEHKVPPKRSVNHNFFETIDTEAKAYLLGLLFADGCNYIKARRIQLSLQERDKELVFLMRSLLESNHKICYYKVKNNDGCLNRQNQYRLGITSQKLCEDLSKLGCTPNKSFTLEFPTKKQVPDHLLNHFIRGYFDGDGSIGLYWMKGVKTFKPGLSLISSKNFCMQLNKIIVDKFGFKFHEYKKKDANPNLLYLEGSTFFTVTSFLLWLYKDAHFFLARKHEKFLEIKNYYDKIEVHTKKDLVII